MIDTTGDSSQVIEGDLLQAGQLSPRPGRWEIIINLCHDRYCPFWSGRACNCSPEINYAWLSKPFIYQ